MFDPTQTFDWWLGIIWFAGIALAAVLVAWVATDIGRMRRTAYIGVLTALTGGLTAGYLVWAGAGRGFWTYQWEWGIIGAVVVAGIMASQARRFPAMEAPAKSLDLKLAWEGVIYGTSEALLLSVLPVLVAWQTFSVLGWTGPVGAQSLSAAGAVVASGIVIVAHHLGYWEFRGSLMRYPIMSCGVLSIGYVLTGNPFVPIIGHIALHTAMIARGVPLPPHPRPVVPATPAVPSLHGSA
jgi:hypothetical protein